MSDTMQSPAPMLPSEVFLQFIEASELRAPFVEERGEYLPYHEMDRVSNEDIDWRVCSGKGELAAMAVFHRRYSPDFDPPYNVALIKLDEGLLILSSVIGEPGALRTGARVCAAFPRAGHLVFELDAANRKEQP